MSFKTYRPNRGGTIAPDEIVLGIRKAGENLFAAFRLGEDLAKKFGVSVGDQVDVARGEDGDSGLVRISKPGTLKLRKSGGAALQVWVPAAFFGISRKYKDQRCPSSRLGPKGELFAKLPAFARKASATDDDEEFS